MIIYSFEKLKRTSLLMLLSTIMLKKNGIIRKHYENEIKKKFIIQYNLYNLIVLY